MGLFSKAKKWVKKKSKQAKKKLKKIKIGNIIDAASDAIGDVGAFLPSPLNTAAAAIDKAGDKIGAVVKKADAAKKKYGKHFKEEKKAKKKQEEQQYTPYQLKGVKKCKRYAAQVRKYKAKAQARPDRSERYIRSARKYYAKFQACRAKYGV